MRTLNRDTNGKLFLMPRVQYLILITLYDKWGMFPAGASQIADEAGIKRNDIYNQMKKIVGRGWVNTVGTTIKWHPNRKVPHYRISALGLAALEYGRLERES